MAALRPAQDVAGLVLYRRHISDRAEESAVVEPVDPFQRGEFEVAETVPRAPSAYEFSLLQTDHRLGHGVVVRVAPAPDRSHRPRLGQPFGVPD